MTAVERNALILLAAGRSSRMKGSVADKILWQIQGKSLFQKNLESFSQSNVITDWIVVYRDQAQKEKLSQIENHFRDTLPSLPGFQYVRGGAERFDSVKSGFAHVPETVNYVLIHDGARPFVSPLAIQNTLTTAKKTGAAVLARPVVDTIRQTSVIHPECFDASGTLDRSRLIALETPQVFSRKIFQQALDTWPSGPPPTDDTTLVTHAGHSVTWVWSPTENRKITYPEDLLWSDQSMSS